MGKSRWNHQERGEPLVIYGDGSQTYDFIYMRDMAKANVLALKNGQAGSFYNVGLGEGTNLTKLAKILLRVTGREDGEIRYESQGVTYVTQRIGSTKKAEDDLCFRAETPLEEGLRNLIEWKERDKRAIPLNLRRED